MTKAPLPPPAPPPGGESIRGYKARPADTEGAPWAPATKLRWRIGKMILWFIEGARLREAWEIDRVAADVARRESRLRQWQDKP